VARTLRVLDIFVSSPSDVNPERQLIIDAAKEWNSLNSKARGTHLNILTWEDAVAPALGERPQAIINEQIGDQYDAFIGLMWSRFGSYTGLSDSGTVEEFERALNRYRDGEKLRLAMIFKISDIPTSILDGEQYAKVQSFKVRYSREGGMYREFGNLDELRIIINRLLDQIAGSETREGLSPSVVVPAQTEGVGITGDIEDQSDELGIIEIRDAIEALSNQQGEFLSEWSSLINRNTDITSRISDDLQSAVRIGNINPDYVNIRMREAAESLDRISDFLNNGLPAYAERNDEIARLVGAAIDVSSDFPAAEAQDEWRVAARSLINGVRDNYTSTQSLNRTLGGIPRLSGVFNKARNKVVRANDRIIQENVRLEGMLEELIR
jgi:hypothetical protein